MREQTKLKLHILQDKGVVSEAIIQKVYKIEEMAKLDVTNIDDLDTDFMFTHLTMALDRVSKNTQLTEVNEIIKEQILNSEHYTEGNALLQKISQAIEVSFNEPESIMILLHLCNLVSQRGE